MVTTMASGSVVCVTQDPVGMSCPCPTRSRVQQLCTVRLGCGQWLTFFCWAWNEPCNIGLLLHSCEIFWTYIFWKYIFWKYIFWKYNFWIYLLKNIFWKYIFWKYIFWKSKPDPADPKSFGSIQNPVGGAKPAVEIFFSNHLLDIILRNLSNAADGQFCERTIGYWLT